jgi:hypothetical protein
MMTKKNPKIDNVIATDQWYFKQKDGSVSSSKIIVGRPRPERKNKKDSDWICPIYIEGFTTKVIKVMGVGQVDSLMNAMTLVKSFFDKVKDHLIDPSKKL